MDQPVVVETVDRVRTITLHRPEARNALNRALQEASAAALLDGEADNGVDVIVLTGTDPAFCAGLDLRELADANTATLGRVVDPATSPFGAIHRVSKPVIGAINGPCVTGGLELALACDFLVASERASFADTHARVGVSPGGGMSVLLPQAVGLRLAKEMSLTGNFLDANEAYRVGLVNHVVPHHELLDTAHALGVDIAGNDSRTVRHLKDLYDSGSRLPAGEALSLEAQIFRAWEVDPTEIEQRRRGVVERGRAQVD